MNDVFMSYASRDRERVEPLVRAIEAQGFDVWWDRDIAHGESYHRVIEHALEAARCAIVVWSRESVDSEWVTNEASEARKRGILVPLLLDEVEPPLEFRHLQSARLFAWRGDADDAELRQLIAAVRGVLQRGGVQRPATAGTPAARAGKSWWETPAGWAVGGAALLVAATVFLLAWRQPGEVSSVPGATEPPATAAPPAATTTTARDKRVEPGSPATPARSEGTGEPGDTVNLLDVRDGAQIVAANESGWKSYIYGRDKPSCSSVATRAFVSFAFRDERRARFDRFGIFVDATSDYNVKTVELYASDQSDQGPFQKIGAFDVPNFRNERRPFHEFTFAPLTARYVKLVVVDWQSPDRPNGNACTMALWGTLQ